MQTRLSALLADIFIPLLIIVPAAWALLPSGLPNTADGPVHFIRSAEMVHAWQEGVYFPRWSANLGYGYGIPLFVYAPPLPYFLTAFFHTFGLTLENAMKAMLMAGLLIASGGAYFLSRHTLGIFCGAVSATAYIYAPIRLRELFIQGNAGQFLAWAFLPAACWGIIRLYQTGHKRYIWVIALAFMGASLSHHVVVLLLALLLAGLTVSLFLATKQLQITLMVIGSGLLGLAISAWFWLPALLEGEYLQLFRIVASDFRNRFVPLAELIALVPPLDSGAINPYYPLTLGAIQLSLAGIGVGWFLIVSFTLVILGRRTNKHLSIRPPFLISTTLFFTLFSLFSAFMALDWSEPVWSRLPFVDLFEFPARWHGVTLVGLAWLSSLPTYFSQKLAKPLSPIIGTVSLTLFFSTALVGLYPQHLPPNFLHHTPSDVVHYEVKTGAVGTTSLGEFNPIWVGDNLVPGPITEDYLANRQINRIPAQDLPPSATSHVTLSEIHAHQFALTLPVPTNINLDLLYFPGWTASLNGNPLPIKPSAETGLINLDLPSGDHQLDLVFRETPLRRLANSISLISWVGLFGISGVYLFKDGRLSPKTKVVFPEALFAQASLLCTTGVILLTLGAKETVPTWFRLASPPGQALPAAMQMQVDLGDQVRLLGLDPPPSVVRQGETFTVVAYWQALQNLDSNYAVFLHLDAPNGQTMVTVDETHPTEIPTSHWPPTLYHRNPLQLTVPNDLLPLRYHLRVGLYDPKTGASLLLAKAEENTTVIQVGQIWVSEQSPDHAYQVEYARFGENISLYEASFNKVTQSITLRWQTRATIDQPYTIFLHLLDDQGQLLGQVDGSPYQNQYPIQDWRVGQVIDDVRAIASAVTDVSQIRQIAVGIYNPHTGERLAAVDSNDIPLVNNALIILLGPQQ